MGRKKRGALRSWLPNQHGAWAMLAVPFAAGVFLGDGPGDGPRWAHLPLFAAWLAGYVTAFHVQQWLRLRRLSRNPRAPRRHVRPALAAAAVSAVFGVPLLFAYPWLLLVAACAAPFVAVNTWYAWRNRERALLNGLAAVVPACGMLLVTLRMGGGELSEGRRPALACLLFFAGTVPYVKTMIRERDSRAYYRASVTYHALAVPVAYVLSPWLAVLFAAYLVRAAVLPGKGLKVPVVGAVEVMGAVLLLAGLLVLF
ncbi:YwiC-like family protein [Streptomyces sp. Je 1-369]|uniref:YwiC-like family protein n=1 Tax=Streptomyces sp. Je 1-369 TaxID=2966192 RepID=UPI002285E8FF|nr:YwiC-like family protein [Streptomyces sp. Je 1-369]WAL97720.1 YwiC-like family protein [Streptomyces sp. Je 1-369]